VREQPVRVAVHSVIVSQSGPAALDEGQLMIVSQSVTVCVEQVC
jgi:hypothetical protein